MSATPQKVYVVMYWNYSSSSLHDVFVQKAAAQAWCDAHNKLGQMADYSVEERDFIDAAH